MAFAAATNKGIAVVGCGVLGTSLCKQLLESPDFDGRTGTCVAWAVVCLRGGSLNNTHHYMYAQSLVSPNRLVVTMLSDKL